MKQWFSSTEALILCLFEEIFEVEEYSSLIIFFYEIDLPLAECTLNNSLNKPIMLNGSCSWSTVLEENVQCVSKLQKRAACVILDADIRERSVGPFYTVRCHALKIKLFPSSFLNFLGCYTWDQTFFPIASVLQIKSIKGCFSQVPRTFGARKANFKTAICLLWKADHLTSF